MLASFLALAGCTVVAVGDSNTCGNLDGCGPQADSWLTRMTLPAFWRTNNRGVGGLAARDAMPHVEAAIAAHPCTGAVPFAARTRVVLALGTNDLVGDATGIGTGLAVLALYDRLRAVPCLETYVATIPPRLDVAEAVRRSANALIRLRVPADHVIPFGDEPVSDLDASGVHITEAGRQRRAEMAQAVLFPGL